MKMSESLLCIDIQRNFVSALLVEKKGKTCIVNGCGLVECTDQSLLDSISKTVTQTGFTGGSCIATLGADQFIYRNLSLPFSDRKKIEQILPFELESHSAVDINDVVFDFTFCGKKSEGSDVIVAMIEKETLSNYIETLEKAGVEPEKIGISGAAMGSVLPPDARQQSMIIDIVDGWATLFLVRNGSVCLIRSIVAPSEDSIDSDFLELFAFDIQQTLLYLTNDGVQESDVDLYLSGLTSYKESVISLFSALFHEDRIHSLRCSKAPLLKINPSIYDKFQPEIMDRVLACGLKGKRQPGEFNFRKGDFSTRKSAEYKIRLLAKLSLPVIILILVAASYLFYGLRELVNEQQELDNQIKEVFTTTLPEITRIVNPLHQLQIINNDIQKSYRPGGEGTGSYSVVALLTELSARIPEKYPIKVMKMVIEKQTIRIKAETADFNIVDNIKKELAKSTLFDEVVIASANQSSKADKITCELKINLAE